jgi:hypothetical protein
VGNARDGRTAANLASLTSPAAVTRSTPATLSHTFFINLPVMAIADLPDWLPDRWKAAQKTPLAALQNQAPHP